MRYGTSTRILRTTAVLVAHSNRLYQFSLVLVSPTWEIIGPLNITAFRKSLTHLVERYEVLRSTFTFDAGRLLCAFTEHAVCPFDEYDCVGRGIRFRGADAALD